MEDEDDENEEKVDDSTQKDEGSEKPDTSSSQGENDQREGAGDEEPKQSDSINNIRRKRTYKPIRDLILNRRIAMEKTS